MLAKHIRKTQGDSSLVMAKYGECDALNAVVIKMPRRERAHRRLASCFLLEKRFGCPLGDVAAISP